MTKTKLGFVKAKDKRGNELRGLWTRWSKAKRRDIFFAQIRFTNPNTGKRRPQKFSLGEKVTTAAQALQELAYLRVREKKGELRGRGGIPTFSDYMDYYLGHARKSEKSLQNERSFLSEWEQYFGSDMRLDKITEPAIRAHLTSLTQVRSERTGQVLSAQSRNLRLYALRSMLRMAFEERRIGRFPFTGIKKEKYEAERKQIPDVADIEKYVQTAIAECPKAGRQFADYLHLLMFTGARETEAVSLQWGDISFERRQIHFHRNTKFGKERWLDFNPKLEALLKEMDSRRDNSREWLFPSPRPNLQGGRITNFRRTLEKVRNKVGVYLSDHYLRHYFTSQAVMAGVDRMVLASWLGHEDGGKLIAKVYGHLSNKYEQDQAEKLTNL
jgi:integrase